MNQVLTLSLYRAWIRAKVGEYDEGVVGYEVVAEFVVTGSDQSSRIMIMETCEAASRSGDPDGNVAARDALNYLLKHFPPETWGENSGG